MLELGIHMAVDVWHAESHLQICQLHWLELIGDRLTEHRYVVPEPASFCVREVMKLGCVPLRNDDRVSGLCLVDAQTDIAPVRFDDQVAKRIAR